MRLYGNRHHPHRYVPIAVTKLISDVLQRNGISGAVASLVIGGKHVGEAVVQSAEVDMGASLIFFLNWCSPNIFSYFATSVLHWKREHWEASRKGSTRTFWQSSPRAWRKQRYYPISFREEALIHPLPQHPLLCPTLDLSLALPSVFFGSIGTAGQRCTSTRRLYLHRSISDTFIERLQDMYAKLQPGDPLAAGTLLGPLHTPQAVAAYEDAIDELRGGGAELLCGGSRYGNSSMADHLLGGNFVQPAISIPRSSSPHEADLWKKEVFAPILNVAIFDELEQAIEWNNAVPQGLSSSLWTRDIPQRGALDWARGV